MNPTEKIKHFTGRSPVEVREWAFVYWVQFNGERPTMLSKKIVDRAAAIETHYLGGDVAARDNKTGKCYMLRSNWSLGHSIKEVAPGTVTSRSSFDTVRGEIVARTADCLKPRTVSEILSVLARNARLSA